MQLKILSVIALVALSISQAYCAPGYVIVKERPLGAEEDITASHPAGWLVTRTFSGSSNSVSILYGPNGYRRDISSFLPDESSEGSGNGGIFTVGLDAVGTVYLHQNAFAPGSVTHIGDRLFKLPLDGDALVPLLQPGQIVDNYAINHRGQFIACDTTEIAAGASFTLRRFNGAELKPISITFPSIESRKKVIVRPEIDEAGAFVVFSTAEIRLKRKKSTSTQLNFTRLTGLCVGSLESEEVRCLTPQQIKGISREKFTLQAYSDAVTGGNLFLQSHRKTSIRYARIDLATLNSTGSFALPRSSDALFSSDGKVSALRDSFWAPGRSRLTVVDSLNNRTDFRCDLGKGVTTIRPSFGSSILLNGGSGSLLVMAGSDATRFLYRLVPTDLSAPHPDAVGQCVAR
jgi:hypothetical protein